jgi:hypothetical protein
MILSRHSNIHSRMLKFLSSLALLLVLLGRGYGQAPAETTFFSTAAEEAYSTLQIPDGDGDLWPSCWADDDNLYTASGDGSAFFKSNISHDMSVSRITGALTQLSGTSLAKSVGTNWIGPGFDRKPTGMLCINSTLYLAFQNLDAISFNSAPAASIAKSTDYGNTWTWDATAPMFGGAGTAPLFTTIFFLDYGKNSNQAIDQYVYAYGLDNNLAIPAGTLSCPRARRKCADPLRMAVLHRNGCQRYADLDQRHHTEEACPHRHQAAVSDNVRNRLPRTRRSDCTGWRGL